MLQGLSEYGVILSGTPENPILENRSGRTVIGYRLGTADQNGHGMRPLMIPAFSGQPAGIPDGGSVYAVGGLPVNLSGQGQGVLAVPILSPLPRQEPIVNATVHSVVFGDGQFVGKDEEWVFEHFGRVLKAIVEVGLLAKAGAWDQLEALDFSSGLRLKPPFDRQRAAMSLVRERKQRGDAAASRLAEIYTAMPTPWK